MGKSSLQLAYEILDEFVEAAESGSRFYEENGLRIFRPEVDSEATFRAETQALVRSITQKRSRAQYNIERRWKKFSNPNLKLSKWRQQ